MDRELFEKTSFAENASIKRRVQHSSVPPAFLLSATRTGRLSKRIAMPLFLTPALAKFGLCANPESFRLPSYGDSLGVKL